MKARPWAFTLKKERDSKTMPSARPLPGTTNEDQTLSFHLNITARYLVPPERCPTVLPPPLAKAAAASFQHPTHRKFSQTTMSTPKASPSVLFVPVHYEHLCFRHRTGAALHSDHPQIFGIQADFSPPALALTRDKSG